MDISLTSGIIIFSITTSIFVFYGVLLSQAKSHASKIARFKKYSKNGIWREKRIYIDPENSTGNVQEGFTFFHPITGKKYPCSDTRPAPKKETRSYVEVEYYLINNDFKVGYIAYLVGVPAYYYADLGIA